MAKNKQKETDVKTALAGLDDQIEGLVGEFIKHRKKAYIKAGLDLRKRMEDQAIEFSELLADKKITPEMFEMLIKQSAAEAKILVLEQSVVSRAKFDELAAQIAVKTAKTLIPIVLAAI